MLSKIFKLKLKLFGILIPYFLIFYSISAIIIAIIYKVIISYDINAFNKRLTWSDAFLLAFLEPITTFYALPIKHTKLYFQILSLMRTFMFYSGIFGVGIGLNKYINIILLNMKN